MERTADDVFTRIDLRMCRLNRDARLRYDCILAMSRQQLRDDAAGRDLDQTPGDEYIMALAGLPDTYTPSDIVAWDNLRTMLSDLTDRDGPFAETIEV